MKAPPAADTDLEDENDRLKAEIIGLQAQLAAAGATPVPQQQQEIDRLKAEIIRLRAQAAAVGGGGTAARATPVPQQQQEIDRLKAEIIRLQAQAAAVGGGGTAARATPVPPKKEPTDDTDAAGGPTTAGGGGTAARTTPVPQQQQEINRLMAENIRLQAQLAAAEGGTTTTTAAAAGNTKAPPATDTDLEDENDRLRDEIGACRERARDAEIDASFYAGEIAGRLGTDPDVAHMRDLYDGAMDESVRLREEARELERELMDAEYECARATQQANEAFRRDVQERDRALNDCQRDLDDAEHECDRAIGEWKGELDACDRDRQQAQQAAEALRRDVQERDRALNDCQRDLDDAERDRVLARQDLDACDRALDDRDRDVHDLRADRDRLQRENDDLRAETNRLRPQVVEEGTARADRDRARTDLEDARARIRTLETDLRNLRDRPPSAAPPPPPAVTATAAPAPAPAADEPAPPPPPAVTATAAPAPAPAADEPAPAPGAIEDAGLTADLIRQLLVCDFDLQTLTNATCERITRALDDFLSEPNAATAADAFVVQLTPPDGPLAPDVPLLREVVAQNAQARGVQPLASANAPLKELLERLHAMYHRDDGGGEAAALAGLRDFSAAFSRVYFDRMRADARRLFTALDRFATDAETRGDADLAADARALRERYAFDDAQWDSWRADYDTAEAQAIADDRYAFTL